MKKFILALLIAVLPLSASYEELMKAVDDNNLIRARSISRYDAVSTEPKAMYNMALLEYVLSSETNALRWLKRSYKAGYTQALFGEAIILFSHSQTPYYLAQVNNDLVKLPKSETTTAFLHVVNDWYNNTNNATALEYLSVGELYYSNPIIRVNIELATKLFRQAANKNSTQAYLYLGDIYINSRQPNSAVLALESYKKAYELTESREAMYKLGEIYVDGPRGVRKIQEGHLLIERAIAGGYNPNIVYKNVVLPLKKY